MVHAVRAYFCTFSLVYTRQMYFVVSSHYCFVRLVRKYISLVDPDCEQRMCLGYSKLYTHSTNLFAIQTFYFEFYFILVVESHFFFFSGKHAVRGYDV